MPGTNVLEIGRPAALPALLAATAAMQAASPTAMAIADVLRGQDGEEDRIQLLARMFSAGKGAIDAQNLEGSFNSLIADHLTAGQRE